MTRAAGSRNIFHRISHTSKCPTGRESPAGRIGNRVQSPDGTAAVSGGKARAAKAGHWGDLRRLRAPDRLRPDPPASQKTCLDPCSAPPGRGTLVRGKRPRRQLPPRPFSAYQGAPTRRGGAGVQAGLLTCGRVRPEPVRGAEPSQVSPMTGFRRPRLSPAYSGGTVRALHPVSYSSRRAFPPGGTLGRV